MDSFFENKISKLEIFFNQNIETPNDIFKALSNVFTYASGVVYFLNPEKLTLRYANNTKIAPKEIPLSKEEKNALYSSKDFPDSKKLNLNGDFVLISHLKIHETIYGILAISSDNKFSKDEKILFNFCALIISNIIKDIELKEIIKIQTVTLQKGIIKSDRKCKYIKKQNKAIQEADKIKTKFISNVSHELRTPLNSIIGFAELLQNQRIGKLNEQQIEYLKDIQTAGINLLGMINEILDISKIESGTVRLNFQTFDINRCIDETLNILKPLFEKKHIKINFHRTNGNITADYQKIQQILFNLINNAIKFSNVNSKIDIHTKFKRKYLEIIIKDYGCGIEKKYHKKIFKKFEQINEMKNSTGLGLTITKELILLHKGKINLKSELGKGTEFIINLPISTI